MRITEHVSLVGSGNMGVGLTHALDCNVWLIDTEEGLLLIDAGVGLDNEAIVDEIVKLGYSPSDLKYIFITHAHADHAAGATYFSKRFGAEVIADPHEATVLGDTVLLRDTMKEYVETGMYPQGYEFDSVSVHRTMKDGERIQLGIVDLEVLVTPGHTGGGLCLYGKIDGKRMLFCGDVLFFHGKINLLSIFDGDLKAYKESVLRLNALQVDTLLAGHLQPVVNRGDFHIEKAAQVFKRFAVPPSIVV